MPLLDLSNVVVPFLTTVPVLLPCVTTIVWAPEPRVPFGTVTVLSTAGVPLLLLTDKRLPDKMICEFCCDRGWRINCICRVCNCCGDEVVEGFVVSVVDG